MKPIDSVVIVGGGTAGWMTAAAFAKFLPKSVSITLVESDEIGTVGVGEATIPQINLFNAALGLDEDEFLRATQGTFKLGIQFVDWFRKGEAYVHAFGEIGRSLGLLPFHHYWLRARGEGPVRPLGDYVLNTQAALAGKMHRGAHRTTDQLAPMPRAYHFDAGLYARFLRGKAEAWGVKRVEGRIAGVRQNAETGAIEAVRLAEGAEIGGGFFVDCSGFRGLLIEETLRAGYEDWTRWLPCDRALAVPCESVSPLTPYTRSTSRQAGWQWRIPLQHRIGNGHVYCSAFLSDDEAQATLLSHLDGKALADPRPLRFTTGRRKRFWDRNVVAVGLASGFMEPLESTSIHLIQASIERILKFWPDAGFDPKAIETYNRLCATEFERIRDFIVLHYHANDRQDSEFWRHCRTMAIPDTLTEKLALWSEHGRFVREQDELFTEVGWAQVLIGQGVLPRGAHPLTDVIDAAATLDYLETVRRLIEREVAAMPTHEAFIAQHCRAG